MNKYRKIFTAILTVLFAVVLFFSCKDNTKSEGGKPVVAETTTSGTVTLYVDNTVQPIMEDVLAVFHSIYNRADINQVNLTENEIVNLMLKDSARLVVLPRMLTDDENKYFEKRNLIARPTHFATDAIALVVNENYRDSIIDPQEVYKILKGESSAIKQLVFDNPNSSTVQYLLKKAGVDKVPSQNVYSLKSNQEVIKFVKDNNGSVGIVGVNWLVQPPVALRKDVDNIRVLAVKNVKTDSTAAGYYQPSQTHIATGEYPFTRKLYLLNYQGKKGLGTGFAIYLDAREGQRIILKSGLLPKEIPSREIEVRTEL